ncbi:fimbria/pilus periplasmic chaperone [Altererythrobacter soli]|uniref:Fimbria/pilus periplasmic chaperone n=1 Tax=Croceibacterium soli TaxID=1739690 RepID=A0A6I4UUC4_9SPHN|nr:fimbria/pilus periplasmic chaperone [Croceibacterium soli]MXP42126.1 fimbria/pilus periplasmic chaperone [Croceibacterium soli]
MRRAKLLFPSVPAALLAATPTAAPGYDLRPIVIQLAPSGAGASDTVVITNSHAVPIAIEVRAYQRSQNPDGTDRRIPEDNDIIITPPQMVIAPGASQSIRLRWIGESNPERELAFRIVTEQLPIALGPKRAGEAVANLSLAYRYEAALYVVPPASKPAARISRAAPVEADGKRWLELDIASEGTRRAILDQPSVAVTPQSGQPAVLEGAAVAPLAALNILSGAYRTVRLPWPEGVAFGPVEAELHTGYMVFQ